MVVVATAIVAIFGALLGANYLLGPKVPLYEFQVLRLPLLWWTKWGEVSTTLYAQIQLHNDNVVRTNVHAASFDLFFPNTWTKGNDLVHIGHVMNINQYYPLIFSASQSKNDEESGYIEYYKELVLNLSINKHK